MNINDAKESVNFYMKKYKLQKGKENLKLVKPIAGMLVGSNLAMLPITLPVIIYSGEIAITVFIHVAATTIGAFSSGVYLISGYTANTELNSKIDTLKELKEELKNNINRFENVDPDGFSYELENQFEKQKNR